jgi:hypothetical protein
MTLHASAAKLDINSMHRQQQVAQQQYIYDNSTDSRSCDGSESISVTATVTPTRSSTGSCSYKSKLLHESTNTEYRTPCMLRIQERRYCRHHFCIPVRMLGVCHTTTDLEIVIYYFMLLKSRDFPVKLRVSW